MKRIAKFHKVSEKRFLEDWKDTFPDAEEEEIKKIYADILLPERATAGSAGYDFFSTSALHLAGSSRFPQESGWRWSRTGF